MSDERVIGPAPERRPRAASDGGRGGGSALHLGRMFGIPVRMHWTFPLLLLWVAYSFWGDGLAAVGQMILVVLTVFGCVVLHEFGHALTARRFGIRTRSVTLLPIGGVAQLEGMPEKPGQEIAVAVAGPLVNVVIAGALLAVLIGLGVESPLMQAAQGAPTAEAARSAAMPLGAAAFFWQIAYINIFLVVFNMIPAFPMDGGRVLRALLAMGTDRAQATVIAARVGQVIAVLFVLAGFYVNPFLILIGVFVFFGGMAEANAVRFGDAMSGLRVDDAMMRDFETLNADGSLREAADRLLAGSQHEFPVVSDGQVVGLLDRDDLTAALSRLSEESPVRAAMRTIGPAFEAGQALGLAHRAMQSARLTAAPVRDGDRLVGLLTLENIEEAIAIRTAQRRFRRA